MITQKRERRRARASGQILETKTKIPPLLETYPLRRTQSSEQMGERFEPLPANPRPQPPVCVMMVDSPKDITDPFVGMQDGIFVIEKDLPHYFHSP